LKRLAVYVTRPDGTQVLLGALSFSDPAPNGHFESHFGYATTYLEDPSSFPVDPRNLPLRAEGFRASELEPPLGVFRDALPDQWGRRLLILEHGLAGRNQWEPELLALLGAGGMGALSFFDPDELPRPKTDGSADVLRLDDLLAGAERLGRGLSVDRRVRLLIAAGSSPGGARPKALVRDGASRWIAKLPAAEDRFDMVGLECAALACARRAGLPVPDTKLIELSNQRKALLVERFDLAGEEGRLHMLSLASLLRERRGVYVHGYADLFEAIARYTDADPRREAERLFRQMTFNAAIGNTDEHLKNWLMLHGDDGYALSPAFDLLPDVAQRKEHTLMFGTSAYPPERGTLLSLAREFDIRPVKRILDEACEAAGQFPRQAHKAGVPTDQVEQFAKDIEQRTAALATV
jgi:serine/threonine-protein kinase HipA